MTCLRVDMHQQVFSGFHLREYSCERPHFLLLPRSRKSRAPPVLRPLEVIGVERGFGLGVVWCSDTCCCRSWGCCRWRLRLSAYRARGSPRRWAVVAAEVLRSRTLPRGKKGSRCQCRSLPSSSLTPAHERRLQGRWLSLPPRRPAWRRSPAPPRSWRACCWAPSPICPSDMLDGLKKGKLLVGFWDGKNELKC